MQPAGRISKKSNLCRQANALLWRANFGSLQKKIAPAHLPTHLNQVFESFDRPRSLQIVQIVKSEGGETREG